MDVDYRSLGEHGIRILFERLADPDKEPERVSLLPQLAERASSGGRTSGAEGAGRGA